jgi:hypothetical protein
MSRPCELHPNPTAIDGLPRCVWTKPEIVNLPPLTDLTLQTGSPISGGEGLFS